MPAAVPRPPLDLKKIDFPILAVVGEFDQPYTRTHRLWREAPNFQRVILRNRGHLSSYMAGLAPGALSRRADRLHREEQSEEIAATSGRASLQGPGGRGGVRAFSMTAPSTVSTIVPGDRVWLVVLVSGFLGLMVDGMDLMFLSYSLPSLIEDFQIPRVQAGTLASYSLLGMALGGFFGGWAADRYGRVRVVVWTILLFSVATAASRVHADATGSSRSCASSPRSASAPSMS